MNAALGGESAGGIGTPEFDVTQSGGGPCAFVATQSGGQCGRRHAIEVLGQQSVARNTADTAAEFGQTAARISTRPQPVTLFGGPADPHCL